MICMSKHYIPTCIVTGSTAVLVDLVGNSKIASFISLFSQPNQAFEWTRMEMVRDQEAALII